MRYEIPFDPELYRYQVTQAWIKTNLKIRTLPQKTFIAGIITLAVSMVTIYFSYWGTLLLFISVYLIMISFAQNKWYKMFHQQYFDETEHIIKKHLGDIITWEFTDEHLRHITDTTDLKTKWKAFTHYTISSDKLFIYMDEKAESPLLISAAQIGDIEFEKVTGFIKEKLPGSLPPP